MEARCAAFPEGERGGNEDVARWGGNPMLTRLTVCNFKRFERAEIDLGSPVVFIGPNNSGKTSALQALALWETGLRRWNEKRRGRKLRRNAPESPSNRRDLVAIPVPGANLLWRELHVRDVRKAAGVSRTSNVRIDVIVEGVSGGGGHGRQRGGGRGRESCQGEELALRTGVRLRQRGVVLLPPAAARRRPDPEADGDSRRGRGGQDCISAPDVRALAATETRLDRGAVNVRIGEGRTAEVLRNLCYRIH